MFNYIWPIALVVLSNIFYHVCAKSMPDSANTFAALTATYLMGAACSVTALLCTAGLGGIAKEFTRLNWSPYVMGLAIIGLEIGAIYTYKAGWAISLASIVQNSFLAVALLGVGCLLYREPFTWNKLIGILVCLAGLGILNWK